ncbi:hypothetical protein E3J48_05955 [Candidatus Aerophobetes bacterium]|uniref:RnfC Barrel sandwich hybrid domain-containing protein n=1 Tax=Aerophobetes bacterium TaxID=2030807 RepID=A0A523W245_UNCAE|nr:MAG: hypothetical protein E3J48_05955 [Candidatus Aerophobetes bacterium]
MSELTTIRKERTIHFPGKVLVEEGDKVEPDTIVVRGVYNLRRLFFVEIADSLQITPAQINDYVLKEEGDDVEEGEILAKKRIFLAETAKRSSPVEGTVERISSTSGHIIIREREMDLEPRKVNVAEELGIQGNEIPRYMKKKVGEAVEKGGAIAELPLTAGFRLKQSISPIYGEIKSMDTETGEVVLQRPHEKIELKAGLPGEVEKVISEKGVIIKTRGYRIQGIIGFGKEAFGEVKCVEKIEDSLEGKIIISKKRIPGEELKLIKEKGARGIVLSESNVADIEELFGEEVYSGVTGKVDRGIVLLLLDGFGEKSMKEENWEFFKSLEGASAYLNGMTQIRAGVIRPELIISS